MCCFSRAVELVGATKIFARGRRDGYQALVYSMNVLASEAVAMILPLPVPVGAADDAVRFVDLSGYPRFFEDLRSAFPSMAFAPLSRGAAPAELVERQKLVVHRVGSFEASFVPTLADFARLDERFRLSPDVWGQLPQYADWGFAVFQLSPSGDEQTLHPMAFEFPRRDPSALFFPTVHVHDGTVHDTAHFDHDLYCQAEGILAATLDWTASFGPLGDHVQESASRGLVRASAPGWTRAIHGKAKNEDVMLRAGDVVWNGGDVVSCHGESWTARLHGSYARRHPGQVDPMRRPWVETSRQRLDDVFRALRDGVPDLVAKHGAEWGLAPHDGEIPSFWPNRYPKVQKPGTFVFMGELYTSRVEHQEVAFSFASPPSRDTERAIEGAVRGLLERAVG